MQTIQKHFIVVMIFIFLAGCAGATNQERKAKSGVLIGAGAGALLGNLISKDSKGTIIGAGLGALAGGIVGNQVGAYMDRQEAELRASLARSEAVNIQRVNDTLVTTFKSDVVFSFNSTALKPGVQTEIARVAHILTKYPQTIIRVEGHTDSKGSEAYNQELSERRALAVKNALIANAVQANRIESIGYGETMPIGTDAQNRRVSIVIVPRAQG